MFKLISGIIVIVPTAIFSWRIGENITPEIVAMGTGILGALGGAIVAMLLLFVIMRFTNSDRANERHYNAQRPHQIGQQRQPPVMIIMQSRGQLEDRTWRQ